MVGTDLRVSSRPELTSARVVISAGRALQSAENFRTYLEPPADKLQAAIGASSTPAMRRTNCKDADAPIFAVADYGLVGDLYDILPELTRLL